MTKEEHFLFSQLNERMRIITLYQKYFSLHNCQDIQVTDIHSYANYDFSFLSGASKITGEMKCRAISVNKYPNTFIEHIKFQALFNHYINSGYTTLFISDYEDVTVVFNLNRIFEKEKETLIHYPTFQFCLKQMAANQYDPDQKKQKLIRYLDFKDAELILDRSTLQPIPHELFLYKYFPRN